MGFCTGLNMTNILAVETSTEACSVALQIGGECIAKYSEEPRSHSRLLMPMVQQVLAEAQIKANQLDVIGVSIGPGSFTGLRIGFAAVQGLAYGADIPVAPLSTLKLMVATYNRQQSGQNGESGEEIIALLDARMSEFNFGHYQLSNNNQIEALASDQLVSAQQAIELISSKNPKAIIGDFGNLIELLYFKSPKAIDQNKYFTNSKGITHLSVTIKTSLPSLVKVCASATVPGGPSVSGDLEFKI